MNIRHALCIFSEIYWLYFGLSIIRLKKMGEGEEGSAGGGRMWKGDAALRISRANHIAICTFIQM